MMTSSLNDRSDRVAMGLTDGFTRTAADDLASDIPKLLTKPEDYLLTTTADTTTSLPQRWAAGTVLGLKGDPRINPLSPTMIEIESVTTSIGLAPSQFESVCHDLAKVEVLPAWIEKEMPRHEVRLSRYGIGKYPVTNFEYLQFLRACPDTAIPSSWEFGIFPAARSNHPVYSIPVAAARAYCEWLSQKTGRLFRLPTEAEWEFAAAGETGSEYPWGSSWKPGQANTAELGIYQSTPVGIFPSGQSWCGALDLAGNVEEYTADDYKPYPGGKHIEDDLLLALGSYPVARGGSFTRFYDLARCKRRHGAYPKPIYVLGFRLAETLS